MRELTDFSSLFLSTLFTSSLGYFFFGPNEAHYFLVLYIYLPLSILLLSIYQWVILNMYPSNLSPFLYPDRSIFFFFTHYSYLLFCNSFFLHFLVIVITIGSPYMLPLLESFVFIIGSGGSGGFEGNFGGSSGGSPGGPQGPRKDPVTELLLQHVERSISDYNNNNKHPNRTMGCHLYECTRCNHPHLGYAAPNVEVTYKISSPNSPPSLTPYVKVKTLLPVIVEGSPVIRHTL
jgi:hypothetical protein